MISTRQPRQAVPHFRPERYFGPYEPQQIKLVHSFDRLKRFLLHKQSSIPGKDAFLKDL